MSQADRTELFLSQHHTDDVLVLPNAWDPASARIFAASGAMAIGTTSMGIAAAAGLPDGERLGLDAMLDAIGRIANAIDVPLSADMEAGYGGTPKAVAAAIERVMDIGVAGVNLEDGTGDIAAPLTDASLHADNIEAARAAADARGLHLVINARTDVFLAEVGAPEARIAEAVARGQRYVAAGADCVFVPGGLDYDTIEQLVAKLGAPLNVVANPAISTPLAPTVPLLRELGVARVSTGSGAMRASLALLGRIARDLLGPGNYEAMRAELEGPGSADAYRMAIGEHLRP